MGGPSLDRTPRSEAAAAGFHQVDGKEVAPLVACGRKRKWKTGMQEMERQTTERGSRDAGERRETQEDKLR